MQIKIAQWNIGGGLVRRDDSDPLSSSSYTEDGLEHIIEFLREENPDVVTLQETQERGDYCQAKMIADSIGLPYWVNHSTDQSFFDTEKLIGQAILSRYPIIESRFSPFSNPGFTKRSDEGAIIRSKNGGLTSCVVQTPNGSPIAIKSFHTVPFHFLNIDLQCHAALSVIREIGTSVGSGGFATIIAADFNLDAPSLRTNMPELLENGFCEIPQIEPTTPKGKRLDHVLFSGLYAVESRVLDAAKTDHFPVISILSETEETNENR